MSIYWVFITIFLLKALNFPKFDISKNAFEIIARSSNPIVSDIIPGFSLDASVNQALRAFVKSRLPAGASEAEIKEAADNLYGNIVKSVGARISSEERVIDALYKVTVSKLLNLPSVYKNLTFVALALAVFGLIKSLAFFLTWIVAILAFLVYQIFLALNFMHVIFENRNKEIIIVD